MGSRVWRVVFLTLCLFTLLNQVQAATKKKPAVKEPEIPAMTFHIVRSSVAGCEPNCPQWIAVEGQVKPNSASQFRKFLKKVGKLRLPVIISSPGGDVTSALAIGGMIRERKLDVAVGWTLYTDCGPLDKKCKLPKSQNGVYRGLAMTVRGYCNSACPFILAAGQRRLAASDTFVGVHEISVQPITQRIRYYETYRMVNGKKKVLSRKEVSRKNIVGKVTTKLSKPFDKKLKTYLKTMGVDAAMLDLLRKAPPASIHQLTTQEMNSIGLVTGFLPSNTLVDTALCKGAQPSGNCKVEEDFLAGLKASPPQRTTYGNPMTFTLARSSIAGCEPNCPEWIFADGVINKETPRLLDKLFKKTGNRKLPIVIRSDGGDPVAAMAMGRKIRERRLIVGVGTTMFEGCSIAKLDCRSKPGKNGRSRGALVNNKDYCNSACTLVLAGGAIRLTNYRDGIGVETLAIDGDKPKVSKASTAPDRQESVSPKLREYLDDMGIDPALLALMAKALPQGLYSLSFPEIKATKLISHTRATADLASTISCATNPPAEYCVKR